MEWIKDKFLTTTLHSIGETNEEDQENKQLISTDHVDSYVDVADGPFK